MIFGHETAALAGSGAELNIPAIAREKWSAVRVTQFPKSPGNVC
jgi:hypothetical protein